MKIGIGITSYNRPEHLQFCIEQVLKHTSGEFKLFVYDQSDEQQMWTYPAMSGADWEHSILGYNNGGLFKYQHGKPRGIAYAKNMCLYNLRQCNHIFLLDDDCWPKADGWIDYFTTSGLNHSLYMNERYSPYTITVDIPSKTFYRNSTGCFMYLTKEVIEKAGYFNGDFRKYGMEHAGYSQRIYRAGLTPAPYISLDRTSDFIHSLDLDGPFEGFNVPHKPSLTLSEMNEHIEHNRKVFELECTTGDIYQDFKP